MLYRRDALLPLDAAQPLTLETLYYQLLPSGSGRARRVEARQAPQMLVNKPFYDVQAIIGKAAHGQVHVTLYCDQQEFSELEHGDQLFRVVARRSSNSAAKPSAIAATSPTWTSRAWWATGPVQAICTCATKPTWNEP